MEDESKQKAVIRAKGYILENWPGIMLSMAGKDDKDSRMSYALLIPTVNLPDRSP